MYEYIVKQQQQPNTIIDLKYGSKNSELLQSINILT